MHTNKHSTQHRNNRHDFGTLVPFIHTRICRTRTSWVLLLFPPSHPLASHAPPQLDAGEFRVVGARSASVETLEEDFDEDEFEAVLVDEEPVTARPPSRAPNANSQQPPKDDELKEDADDDLELDLSVQVCAWVQHSCFHHHHVLRRYSDSELFPASKD